MPPEVESLPHPETETRVMTLWNREFTPTMTRELVTRPPAPYYYRIPYQRPVLELSDGRILRESMAIFRRTATTSGWSVP